MSEQEIVTSIADRRKANGDANRVKPLGVLEITADHTRFVPVVDAMRLAMMEIMASMCVVWMLTRAFPKRQ